MNFAIFTEFLKHVDLLKATDGQRICLPSPMKQGFHDWIFDDIPDVFGRLDAPDYLSRESVRGSSTNCTQPCPAIGTAHREDI